MNELDPITYYGDRVRVREHLTHRPGLDYIVEELVDSKWQRYTVYDTMSNDRAWIAATDCAQRLVARNNRDKHD
jgi:hypothetical protein